MSTHYRPAPRVPALGGRFYDPVAPARFPALTLRFRNQRWAERVGLGELTPAEWEAAFARFEPLPDNLTEPLALRYHGHQFRHYNAQLGDGRGFLFAQLLDDGDRLLDLGTKGSGQTPWSRGGDGRLTLKGGVREVLATEMLEALGVYTSKTFSLFETGESLMRNDEPSPTRASVMVRLGHSHIRFGSFQRHAHLGDDDSLRALLEFSIANYAPELCDAGEHAAALFVRLVVQRSARLCAQWMAAGFVHGVLNSDNMNIAGESFDYGPFRFLPVLDPGFTAAYFDQTGLYAYGQQPASVKWNLLQLALALEPIADPSLRVIVDRFEHDYGLALDAALVRRLGIESRGALPDRLLRGAVFEFLDRSAVPFERLFFDWYGGGASEARAARSGIDYAPIRDAMLQTRPHPNARIDHAYFRGGAPCTMLIDEIESLWDAIADADDWAPFEAKVAAVRAMGDALKLD